MQGSGSEGATGSSCPNIARVVRAFSTLSPLGPERTLRLILDQPYYPIGTFFLSI